jgi:hypothetical protein
VRNFSSARSSSCIAIGLSKNDARVSLPAHRHKPKPQL